MYASLPTPLSFVYLPFSLSPSLPLSPSLFPLSLLSLSLSLSLLLHCVGVSTEVHPPNDDLLDQHFEVLDIVGKEEGGKGDRSSRKKDRNKTTGNFQ